MLSPGAQILNTLITIFSYTSCSFIGIEVSIDIT